jgi:voltage-gated potassium channel
MTSLDRPLPSYVGPALAKWQERSSPFIVLLAVFSVPIILLEFAASDLPQGDLTFIIVANVLILTGFSVDYFVGLAKSEHRLAYIRGEWLMGLLVVVSVVTLIPGLSSIGSLRLARLARLGPAFAGIVRLFAAGSTGARRARVMVRKKAFKTAVAAALVTWLTSAAAFTLVEDVGVNGRIDSFFTALWWSAATITTVGYGDIYPITPAGRAIGVFTMVLGFTVFAVVTAGVAAFFVEVDEQTSDSVAINTTTSPASESNVIVD